jgi:hypothetical protein
MQVTYDSPKANSELLEREPQIIYTLQDFKLLVVRMSEEHTKLKKHRQAIYVDTESLLGYLTERIAAGESYGNTAETAHKKRLGAWIRSRYHSDYYKVLFERPLEDMPLLINEPDIGSIARWRLEIGK